MSDESDSLGDFDSVDFDIPGFEDTPGAVGSSELPEPAAEVEAAPESEVEQAEAEEAPAQKAEEEKSPETAAQAAARLIKFAVGEGKESEIPETATVTWKVDGKPTEIPVRELLDNYSGKVAYEKRFQSLANERKAFDTDRRSFESARDRQKSLVVDLYEKTRAGQTFEAVQSLIEATGLKVDAREYVKQLRNAMVEQAQKIAGMSPEQREVHELNEEREYLKAQYAKLHQQRQEEEAGKAFQGRVAKVAEENGYQYDELAQGMEWLKQQVRANGGDPNSVTPEYTVEHKRNVRSYEVARDAIAAVEPSLLKDGIITDEAKWDQLAKLARQHQDIDVKEFVELYRQTRQTKQAQAVGKKLEKAPVSTPAKASVRKPKNPAASASDFSKFSADDLSW
jgi:hypothetical protein